MNKLALAICSTVIKLIAVLGSLAIFSRLLSLEFFSYLTLGLLIAQVSSIFIDAGINNEILRFSRIESENESWSRLERSTAVRITLGGMVFLVCAAYSLFMINAELNAAIFISAYLSGLLASICESYLINLRAKNKFSYEFYFVFAQSALILTLPAMSFLNPWLSIPALLAPRIIAYLILSRSSINTIQVASMKEIKNHYKNLRFYSVDAIFSNVSIQADAILVSILVGKEAYALYQPLSKMYTAAISFAAAIGSYFLPLASTYINPRKQFLVLNIAFTSFGLIGALAFGVFSEKVIILFFGSQFIVSHQITLLLTLIIAARYATAGSGSFMTIAGMQKHRAVINAIVTSVCVAAALIFARAINEILIIVLAAQVVTLILSVVISTMLRNAEKEKSHAY